MTGERHFSGLYADKIDLIEIFLKCADLISIAYILRHVEFQLKCIYISPGKETETKIPNRYIVVFHRTNKTEVLVIKTCRYVRIFSMPKMQ